jgi:4-hydroxy-3-polyprenylbenzoate decarboxylase
MTGASGAIYGVRLLDVLRAAGCEVHVAVSGAGRQVLEHELGPAVDAQRPTLLDGPTSTSAGPLHCHAHDDLMSPIASGSFLTDGMVVCPCSGGTLAAIAHGMSLNLIHRAAEVHLKERRRLVLVPRETPLSLVHLDNLKRAAELGAIVLPAAPGFYHRPQSIAELVDFVVARICDQLGVEHTLVARWGEP